LSLSEATIFRKETELYKDRNYYYKILGLKPGASQVEIKSAYRRLVKLYHPDMCKSADSMAMYKEVRTAYDKLSNWDYSSVTDVKTATKTSTNAGTYAKTATKTNTGTTSSRVSYGSQWTAEEWENIEKAYYKEERRNEILEKIFFLVLLFLSFLLALFLSGLKNWRIY